MLATVVGFPRRISGTTAMMMAMISGQSTGSRFTSAIVRCIVRLRRMLNTREDHHLSILTTMTTTQWLVRGLDLSIRTIVARAMTARRDTSTGDVPQNMHCTTTKTTIIQDTRSGTVHRRSAPRRMITNKAARRNFALRIIDVTHMILGVLVEAVAGLIILS